VLLAREVSAEQKAQLQRLHGSLNPFPLGREIERRRRKRSKPGAYCGLEKKRPVA
jgi:hypothetical protein